MLYWCEGDKYSTKSRCKVGVTCADARLLELFVDWLVHYYNINKNAVKLRLHIWNGTNENEAKEYWSNMLGIPLQNFTKSWIKPKSGKHRRYPYGICRASIDSKKIFLQILSEIRDEFEVTSSNP